MSVLEPSNAVKRSNGYQTEGRWAGLRPQLELWLDLAWLGTNGTYRHNLSGTLQNSSVVTCNVVTKMCLITVLTATSGFGNYSLRVLKDPSIRLRSVYSKILPTAAWDTTEPYLYFRFATLPIVFGRNLQTYRLQILRANMFVVYKPTRCTNFRDDTLFSIRCSTCFGLY